MPKETNTHAVKPLQDDPFCYTVESWTSKHQKEYLVDVLDNDGNGSCSCPDFKGVCQRNLKEHGEHVEYGVPGAPDKRRTQCKHLYLARKNIIPELFKMLAKEHR